MKYYIIYIIFWSWYLIFYTMHIIFYLCYIIHIYIYIYLHIYISVVSTCHIYIYDILNIYTMNTDRGRSTVKPWLTTIFKLQARLPDRQQKTALSSRLAQLKTSSAARQLASLDSRASRGIVFDCMMHIHCTILCNVTFSYVSVCVYLSATIYLYIYIYIIYIYILYIYIIYILYILYIYYIYIIYIIYIYIYLITSLFELS